MNCRSCGAPLKQTLVYLGHVPLSNAYVSAEAFGEMEPTYPLVVLVCNQCWLVQLQEYESPETIFGDDYAYFSSCSTTWLEHAEQYVELMIERFGYGPGSHVVEVASNDGYLLQYFAKRGVPVLGIEPARGCAEAATAKGVPTEIVFFGAETARRLRGEGRAADLLLGNNVLAHVPDVNDFVSGLKIMLNSGGVLTMEFPHLLRLIEGCEFDTIYHEHFSYFSLSTALQIFAQHGLAVFDVEELPTHGGSLRVYARHQDEDTPVVEDSVGRLVAQEAAAGMNAAVLYQGFQERVMAAKRSLLRFLIDARDHGKTVVGYGAPAKGNTLLNYCGIRDDLIEFTVDINPAKQGKYLPGSHLPIKAPDAIREVKPDFVLILPWNIKDEIMEQMADIRDWGGRFVLPLPTVRVVD